ncbi:MFS transporter [Algihabitans albus]|uniref:MFS transporter n=1 Tax=Algihabitans albus TaxID=2164067 RepID=UPI000E5C8F0C|nr:MFS transporter [Algihabitans albus]
MCPSLRSTDGRPSGRATDWPLLINTLISVTAFGVALGMSYPLLAINLKVQGASATLIGLNSAAMGAGILASSFALPALLKGFGPRTVMLFGLLGSAVAIAGFALISDLAVWFFLRVLLGFCLNATFVIAEALINARVDPAVRGRVVGLYTSLSALGFGIGPLLLILTGTSGLAPYLVVIGLIALSLLAVLRIEAAAVSSSLPSVGVRRMAAVALAAPGLLLLVGVHAVFDMSMMQLLPVYVIEKGLSAERAPVTLTAFLIGMVTSQIFIGWLLDITSKTAVVFGCSLATAVACLLLPVAVGSEVWLWVAIAASGAASFGLYTVALAGLGARFSGGALLSGTVVFGLIYGAGSVVGPAASGAAMGAMGPDAAPLLFAALFLCLALSSVLKRRGIS